MLYTEVCKRGGGGRNILVNKMLQEIPHPVPPPRTAWQGLDY